MNSMKVSSRIILRFSSSSSTKVPKSFQEELCQHVVNYQQLSEKEGHNTIKAVCAFNDYFQNVYGKKRWESLGRALLLPQADDSPGRTRSTAGLLNIHGTNQEVPQYDWIKAKIKKKHSKALVLTQIPWAKPLVALWGDQGQIPLLPPSRLDDDSNGLYDYYCIDPASLLPVLALFGCMDKNMSTIINKDVGENKKDNNTRSVLGNVIASFLSKDSNKHNTSKEKQPDPSLGTAEERMCVLDMCAAPGGKTLAILQAMTLMGSGVMVANEPSPIRRQKLERVLNQYCTAAKRGSSILVTKYNGVVFGKNDGMIPVMALSGSCVTPEDVPFSHVLLDAPCSGERHLLLPRQKNKNKNLLSNWKDNRKNQKRQLSLLKAAIAACREEGTIVYSTCSINPRENDDVVEKVLSKRGSLASLKELDFCIGERTKFGWIILPDHPSSLGLGPMYIAAFRRLSNSMKNADKET